MKRIPEPELMTDECQAAAYSNADFATSNGLFVQYILNNSNKAKRILDIGCGPGDVDIEMAVNFKEASIVAVDGSMQMIKLAERKIRNHKLADRIHIVTGILPGLPVDAGKFDIIISKDVLHHIPDPSDFWNEIGRLSDKNTIIYVMDLIRPGSEDEAKHIVESVSSDEPEILKADFYNSLLAAFTIDEIKEQIGKTGMTCTIQKLGDRHFVARCRK